MEPIREEPAQLPPEHAALVEAPGPSQLDAAAEDPVPRPITLQDVRNYLEAADEEEWAIVKAELTPDTREATTQVAMLPGCRSFPSQTSPPSFTLSTNPDGSVTLAHSSIHIRILDLLTRRE